MQRGPWERSTNVALRADRFLSVERVEGFERPGHVPPDGRGGGEVDANIPKRELDYYASRLLGVGTDVTVWSPLSSWKHLAARRGT